MTLFLIVLGWLACALLAAGWSNANWRATFPNLNTRRHRREDLAFSIGMSLVAGPMAMLVIFFATGFAQDGWTLNGAPLSDDERESLLRQLSERANP